MGAPGAAPLTFLAQIQLLHGLPDGHGALVHVAHASGRRRGGAVRLLHDLSVLRGGCGVVVGTVPSCPPPLGASPQPCPFPSQLL